VSQKRTPNPPHWLWDNKRLRNMLAAGFFSLEAYDAWKAEQKLEQNKNHPNRKSDEHNAERRRIRDQWRNYRKQVKVGMAANGGRIPSGWFAAQLHRQSHCCAICSRPFGDGNVEIDHIVPVAKGGPNVMWNLQLTHSVCNIQKSDLMPWEFKVAA
jgi:5-methylcytosine-specific restriction endonuclease McrA